MLDRQVDFANIRNGWLKTKKRRSGERKEKSLTVDPTAGGRKGRKRQAEFTLREREREAGLPDGFHFIRKKIKLMNLMVTAT